MISLESNTIVAVFQVAKGCPPTHPWFSIVSLIDCLMMKDRQVAITHIYRQEKSGGSIDFKMYSYEN